MFPFIRKKHRGGREFYQEKNETDKVKNINKKNDDKQIGENIENNDEKNKIHFYDSTLISEEKYYHSNAHSSSQSSTFDDFIKNQEA